MPLAGTIAVVTFVGAYVPFVGAWVSGAFAVLIALGTGGTSAALIMAVVALLANGVLQQLIQPFVMGATLGLNPLVVLVVTIGAGALFGMVGLTLAAPLTSAAVHISNELRDRDGPPTSPGVPRAVPPIPVPRPCVEWALAIVALAVLASRPSRGGWPETRDAGDGLRRGRVAGRA